MRTATTTRVCDSHTHDHGRGAQSATALEHTCALQHLAVLERLGKVREDAHLNGDWHSQAASQRAHNALDEHGLLCAPPPPHEGHSRTYTHAHTHAHVRTGTHP
jgi:hypothetical protein